MRKYRYKFGVWIAALVLGGAGAVSCGAGKSRGMGAVAGDTHSSTADPSATGSGQGQDVPLAGRADTAELDGGGGDQADAGVAPDAAPVPPAVAFRIINTGLSPLSFNMNKGWQPVIFAWSGQRGKGAKPIIMFEKHCTASCDVDREAVCPYCPAPVSNRQARAQQAYEHVEPGASIDVPWDGQVFAYEPVQGLQDAIPTSCECWRRQSPPPEDYTVWACGVRLTAQANVRSRPQCVEQKMHLPVGNLPIVITFEFPEPPKQGRRR